MLVNFRKDPRQIPCRQFVTWRPDSLRPLHETPAVLLKVMPVPIGQHRLHHRFHFLRHLRQFRLQTCDLFLGFITLNGRFKGNFLSDRLDCFGVSLVFNRRLDNRIELFDGGFR